MEHYDMRVIADCVVYSYEVPGPAKQKEKTDSVKKRSKQTASRSARRRAHQTAALRTILLRVLFVLLAPFALLIDGMAALAHAFVRALRVSVRRPVRGISALGAFSFLAVIFSHFQGL